MKIAKISLNWILDASVNDKKITIDSFSWHFIRYSLIVLGWKNWLEDSRRCCKHSSVIWHIWNQILTLFTRCYSRRFLQLSIVPPMSSSAAVANGFTYYAFQRCYAAYLGNVWLLESVLLSYQLKAGWPYCSYLWLQLGFFAFFWIFLDHSL